MHEAAATHDDVTRLLANRPELIRAHGFDAEASLVRALTTGENALDVRDKLTLSRVDSLATARTDLTRITSNPDAPPAARDAATERITQIDSVTTLANLALRAAHLTERPIAVDERFVAHVHGDPNDWQLTIYAQTDAATMTRQAAAKHHLTHHAQPREAAWAAGAYVAIVLLIITAVVVPDVAIPCLIALAALAWWAPLNAPLEWWRWTRGHASQHDMDVAALETAQHPELVRPVATYQGNELRVLHALTPHHPLWSTSMPGLTPADGTPAPIHAELVRAATRDDARAQRVTTWLTVALPILSTYLNDPDHDPDDASPEELDVASDLAGQLFTALRDHDAEAAVAREAVERIEKARAARQKRAALLDTYRDTMMREDEGDQ